jgi:D-alanyl-D-alanine carboxypeptidase
MPFKFDAEGKIVIQEVNGQKLPVFVHADGKEAPFDGDATVATIGRLNGEAKSHRERAEAAETSLKTFEGIADPVAARKALDTVKNLDDKKLVDAGEVERVKAEAIKAVEEKYAPVVKKAESLEQQLYSEKIGGSFSRSKVIADKFAIPADLVQARFGNAFKIEDGKTVAYDQAGNKIFSRTRPGELADFDEALEVLVDQYPYKDQILKGSGSSGSGAGSSTGNAGGKKTITRSAFEALDPAARAAAMKDGTTVTD